jgi:hypothetical protein
LLLAGIATKDLASGNMEGARAMVKEINQVIDENRSPKKKGEGGAKGVGGDMETETKEAVDAEKKKQEEQQKTMDLYRQADDIHRRQMLNAMTDEDKLLALMQERADLQKKINQTPEGLDRAKLVVDQAKLDTEIGPLQKKVQADVMNNMIGGDKTKGISARSESMQILADSLQKVGGGGGFARVGGTETIQKDQLTALKSIDKGIAKLAQSSSSSTEGAQ